MTEKERYKALASICRQYALRLYRRDTAENRRAYEKVKAERDALRKQIFG